MRKIIATIVTAALLAFAPALFAQGPSLNGPMLVVALKKLDGTLYERTVMFAVAYGGGHVGLILNKPTGVTMSMTFPNHAPSANVTEPIYFGGPNSTQIIIALAKAEKAPSEKALEMMPGIWLVVDGTAIDRIIEQAPSSARYFAGLVVWRPGALAKEIREGEVHAMPVDKERLFLKDTTRMYDELVPPNREKLIGA